MSFESVITFLPTRDLKQTARFYEGVLKLELALDQTRCRIYRVTQGGFLGFCLNSMVFIYVYPGFGFSCEFLSKF